MLEDSQESYLPLYTQHKTLIHAYLYMSEVNVVIVRQENVSPSHVNLHPCCSTCTSAVKLMLNQLIVVMLKSFVKLLFETKEYL